MFNSDSKMGNLFHSEDLQFIEFSEYPSHGKNNKNDYNLSQEGGDGSLEAHDIDYLFTDDRSYYMDQEGGAFSDGDFDVPNIDYLFQTEAKQMGGASATERDFLSVFNAANEYSKRISELPKNPRGHQLQDDHKSTDVFVSDNFDDQYGGKREMPPAVIGMQEIASKKLKPQEDYIEKKLKSRLEAEEKSRGSKSRMQAVFIKIAAIIWRDAEKKSGGKGADTDKILRKALELAGSDLDKYLEEYKDEPLPKFKEKKQKKKKE
jgi:hypothetical protein